MDWVKLIVPLIAIVVYLISHVISARQEEMKRRALQPKKRTEEEAVEDLKVLMEPEEIKRKKLEQRIVEARQRREALEEANRRRPQRTNPRYDPNRPAPVQDVSPKPMPQASVLPKAVLVAEVPFKAVHLPSLEDVLLPMYKVAPKVTTKTPAQKTLAIINDKQALATAFLLQEILGPPRSRRGPKPVSR